MSYLRPIIDQLNAYEPGEQPPPGSDVIKLNTNENPYPPSDTAIKALRMVNPDRLRLYPQPLADEFRQSAARVLKVDPEWILVGNGSDDLLTMLFRSMADTERSVAYPVPTYVLYRTLAEIQDTPVVEVPFDDDYALPVDTLARAGASLTLIANPNSPSGTRAPNTALAELAARVPGVLAIDEAYVAFAAETALELVQRFPTVSPRSRTTTTWARSRHSLGQPPSSTPNTRLQRSSASGGLASGSPLRSELWDSAFGLAKQISF